MRVLFSAIVFCGLASSAVAGTGYLIEQYVTNGVRVCVYRDGSIVFTRTVPQYQYCKPYVTR